MKPIPLFIAKDASDLAQWLLQQVSQARIDAQDQVNNLYAIIDTPRLQERGTVEDLLKPFRDAAPIVNLYGDFGGHSIASDGPRLIAVPLGSMDLLHALCTWSVEAQAVSFLYGVSSFENLSAHLQHLREVTLPDGTLSLFRYQDTYVTYTLAELLKNNQADVLLGTLTAWVTINPCQQVRTIVHGYAFRLDRAPRTPQRFSITENQLTALSEKLRVPQIRARVMEVDATLLQGKSSCEIYQGLADGIEKATELGLRNSRDIELYSILRLQLPNGFEKQPPFHSIFSKMKVVQQPSFWSQVETIRSEQWEGLSLWAAGVSQAK